MLSINKITSNSTVDFAAEELKKYLRMMMPEAGNIDISYAPDAKDGFCLGLMQDFGLDTSDAEDTELDDILYIDCDTEGGIIAGDNPRSVLLAVYEYLRQNGCRFLLPGVDGEFIPMQDITPTKYRHKPSCRYRGWCNEGAETQEDMLLAIDFAPKVGLNVFMLEFFNPVGYYRKYYTHMYNTENRRPEKVSDRQIFQWKRQCEAEISKRGLQFHDIGHGWTADPFGLDTTWKAEDGNLIERMPEEMKKYLPMINGERIVYENYPFNTNFCMSSAQARKIVVDYIVDYSKKHTNADYIHVWLADGTNNHCECEECKKKTPSDWYMILMNELDEALTEAGLKTRIVFISYVDTTWAPLTERIKNSERFTLLFAPIFRSYAYSIPENTPKTVLVPFKHNKNVFPDSLAASFDYFEEWKKIWHGANLAYEYHFWRFQTYDLSGIRMASLINEDIKNYKKNDVNGVIEDGTQRPFFPNGLAFFSYARTLFDTSLSIEEIIEDYFSHAYGEGWEEIRDYLISLEGALPFEFFSRDEARKRQNVHYDPERAGKIASIREITKRGREIIERHYESDYRVRTVFAKLLLMHAEFCDLTADWMAAKARGELSLAEELYHKARIEIGKYEREFEYYYDQSQYFSEYKWALNQKSPSSENIITV